MTEIFSHLSTDVVKIYFKIWMKPVLTSKPTETSLFIIFTNVRLVIPPHCGSEVLRGSDWSFPAINTVRHFVWCVKHDTNIVYKQKGHWNVQFYIKKHLDFIIDIDNHNGQLLVVLLCFIKKKNVSSIHLPNHTGWCITHGGIFWFNEFVIVVDATINLVIFFTR